MRHELFIVSDSKLQVTGHDTLFLVITGSIASKLENLSGEVFKNGGQVDWKADVSQDSEDIHWCLPGAPAPTRWA